MTSTGSIRKRIDDANFNIEHERYEAALALLLIAIDGSALKVFPKETMSIRRPKEKMGNKERYTRFLGVRLRQVCGIALDDSAYYQEHLPQFVSGLESPEEKIYSGFRCNELHESGLPADLQYVYEPEGVHSQFSLEFSDQGVRFSYGFLRLLEAVVTGAPCNGNEFGIKYFRLRPYDGISTDLYARELGERYNLTLGRMKILIELLQLFGPDSKQINDKELASSLTQLLYERMPGGARTGLCLAKSVKPICEWQTGFTPYGVEILRDILRKADIIQI